MIAKPPRDLFVEFDRAQVRCRTNVPQAVSYIRAMWPAMLVPRAANEIGVLEVVSGQEGTAFYKNGVLEERGGIDALLDVLRLEVLMTFIKSRRDLIWLHAGVVRNGNGATLIAGPSGEGKSTLVTLLSERGWLFLSDDAAPLSGATGEVLPYPQTPRRRVHPRTEVPPDERHTLDRETRPMNPAAIWRGASRVERIVFLEFAFSVVAEVKRLTPGETSMNLIRNCTNFVDHREGAVAGLTELARSVPGYHVRYGDAAAAADAVESLAK